MNNFYYRINIALFFIDLLREPNAVAERIVSNLDFFPNNETMKFSGIIQYTSLNHGGIPINGDISSTFTLNAERCDFILYYNGNGNIIDDFKLKYRSVINAVCRQKGIGRIGLIVHKFYENDNPIDSIMKKYIKTSSPIKKPFELTIRYNIMEEYKNIPINSITTIEKTNYNSNNNTICGISIIRDINTIYCANGLQEEYLTAFIKKYFNLIIDERGE